MIRSIGANVKNGSMVCSSEGVSNNIRSDMKMQECENLKSLTFDDGRPEEIDHFSAKTGHIHFLSSSLNQKFCIDLLQHLNQVPIIVDGIVKIGR